MNTFQSALDVVHFYNIKVYDNKRNLVEYKEWNNMLWAVRIKWDWYFKYYSALLQVKYPKYKVESSWGNYAAKGNALETILKNKIIAKKRKITEYSNKLDNYVKNWNSLFDVTEDVPYLKAVKKIES